MRRNPPKLWPDRQCHHKWWACPHTAVHNKHIAPCWEQGIRDMSFKTVQHDYSMLTTCFSTIIALILFNQSRTLLHHSQSLHDYSYPAGPMRYSASASVEDLGSFPHGVVLSYNMRQDRYFVHLLWLFFLAFPSQIRFNSILGLLLLGETTIHLLAKLGNLLQLHLRLYSATRTTKQWKKRGWKGNFPVTLWYTCY